MITKRTMSDWYNRCSSFNVPLNIYGVREYFNLNDKYIYLSINDEDQYYAHFIEYMQSFISQESVYVHLHEINVFASRRIPVVEDFFKSKFANDVDIFSNNVIEFNYEKEKLNFLLYWMILIGARFYCIDNSGTIIYISQHGDVMINLDHGERSFIECSRSYYISAKEWLHNEDELFCLHINRIEDMKIINSLKLSTCSELCRIPSNVFYPYLLQEILRNFEYPALIIPVTQQFMEADDFFGNTLSDMISTFPGHLDFTFDLDTCNSQLTLIASLLIPNGVPCIFSDYNNNMTIIFDGYSSLDASSVVLVNTNLYNWLLKGKYIIGNIH